MDMNLNAKEMKQIRAKSIIKVVESDPVTKRVLNAAMHFIDSLTEGDVDETFDALWSHFMEKKMTPELDELDIKLQHFDYTYMMSDSHYTWKKGEASVKEITALIAELSPKYPDQVEQLILKHKHGHGHQFKVGN